MSSSSASTPPSVPPRSGVQEKLLYAMDLLRKSEANKQQILTHITASHNSTPASGTTHIHVPTQPLLDGKLPASALNRAVEEEKVAAAEAVPFLVTVQSPVPASSPDDDDTLSLVVHKDRSPSPSPPAPRSPAGRSALPLRRSPSPQPSNPRPVSPQPSTSPSRIPTLAHPPAAVRRPPNRRATAPIPRLPPPSPPLTPVVRISLSPALLSSLRTAAVPSPTRYETVEWLQSAAGEMETVHSQRLPFTSSLTVTLPLARLHPDLRRDVCVQLWTHSYDFDDVDAVDLDPDAGPPTHDLLTQFTASIAEMTQFTGPADGFPTTPLSASAAHRRREVRAFFTAVDLVLVDDGAAGSEVAERRQLEVAVQQQQQRLHPAPKRQATRRPAQPGRRSTAPLSPSVLAPLLDDLVLAESEWARRQRAKAEGGPEPPRPPLSPGLRPGTSRPASPQPPPLELPAGPWWRVRAQVGGLAAGVGRGAGGWYAEVLLASSAVVGGAASWRLLWRSEVALGGGEGGRWRPLVAKAVGDWDAGRRVLLRVGRWRQATRQEEGGVEVVGEAAMELGRLCPAVETEGDVPEVELQLTGSAAEMGTSAEQVGVCRLRYERLGDSSAYTRPQSK